MPHNPTIRHDVDQTWGAAREQLANGTASAELVARRRALIDLFIKACQSAKVSQDSLSNASQNVER